MRMPPTPGSRETNPTTSRLASCLIPSVRLSLQVAGYASEQNGQSDAVNRVQSEIVGVVLHLTCQLERLTYCPVR